jgi:hypothetical protein
MAKITGKDVERLLGNVPEKHVFWCCDGRVFRSMRELAEAFDSMTDETFAHHSNQDRCDFGNWVRDVIGDGKLARDLDKSQAPTQAGRRVAERVEFLSARSA